MDGSAKTWEDGYESAQRINFGGKVTTEKNAVQITLTGPAAVKIWWVQGGDDNREMALLDANGEIAAISSGTYVKNSPYISELELEAGGVYYLGGATNNNNIYKVEVTTGAAEKPPRADWAEVPAPAITDVSVDGGNITVSVSAQVGYDGADKVTVEMRDAAGELADSKSSGREQDEYQLVFTPSASGTYTFAVSASRNDEETVHEGAETVSVDFVLPLAKPQFISAGNAGGGTVHLEWEPVAEAEQYELTVEGTDLLICTEALEADVSGLTPGETYAFLLTALRGEERSGTDRIECTVTEAASICLFADPEAQSRPVIDFGGKSAGIVLASDWWHLKGFDVTNSANGEKGVQVSSKHNVLELLETYRNGNTGIQISRYKGSDQKDEWPADNRILNCTSYLNADRGYEDADGFAAKLTIGEGNVFDGCISHHNADDGWDLYAKIENGPNGRVVIQNSVAYKNGYILDEAGNEINAGNGNGFKMGGESVPGGHTLINSVAFTNKSKGIDSNSCPDIKAYQSTSFDNESYNVAFYTNTAVNTDFAADGVLSYKKSNTVAENIKPVGSQDLTAIYGPTNFYDTNGSFQNSEGLAVSDDWFVSLDTAAAIHGGITRNPDGSINMNGYLELTDAAPEGVGARFPVWEPAPENPFTDVKEGKYYYDAVLWAYCHEPQITAGVGDGLFGVKETCTRAQIVTFLWKALGEPEHHVTENPFTDVKAGKWYYDAVMWAYENDITHGGGDGLFGVKENCNRGDAMTFLWNALEKPEPETTENPFEDVKEGKYYYKAVLWAVENGITSGSSETSFSPKDPCTRAQIVTFLYLAMQLR